MKLPDRRLDETAFVGICFPSKRFFRNPKRLFMPASTTKLYTSWLACETLGEDFSFHSEYSVQGKTLYVNPMGNPLLSEASFRGLLEVLERRSIDEIVFSHHLPELPHYPSTWAIGDVREAWGAPISDICFHENYATVDGSTGGVVSPSSSYYSVRRVEGLTQPLIRGRVVSIPSEYKGTLEFPILDPEGFLFHWLRERIPSAAVTKRRGRLRGTPIPFAHAPLREVLKTMNKESSNILAELLLVHASRARRKPLDYEKPQSAFTDELPRIRVRDALLYDGSGVSRYNLVSPAGTVAVLEASKEYPSIVDSLPIGGKDGTLANRKLPSRIHAKTGSLTGVQALAGYDNGEPFAIMINHGPPDERMMIEAIDRVVTGR